MTFNNTFNGPVGQVVQIGSVSLGPNSDIVDLQRALNTIRGDIDGLKELSEQDRASAAEKLEQAKSAASQTNPAGGQISGHLKALGGLLEGADETATRAHKLARTLYGLVSWIDKSL